MRAFKHAELNEMKEKRRGVLLLTFIKYMPMLAWWYLNEEIRSVSGRSARTSNTYTHFSAQFNYTHFSAPFNYAHVFIIRQRREMRPNTTGPRFYESNSQSLVRELLLRRRVLNTTRFLTFFILKISQMNFFLLFILAYIHSLNLLFLK